MSSCHYKLRGAPIKWPEPGAFDVLILDEVHKLKNSNSLNYSACYKLDPKITWGLSGTPLENRPSDLAAILHLIDRKRVSLSDEHLPLESLRSTAAGYMLRRDKLAIAEELPQVLEKLDLVPLTPKQRSKYEEILQHGRSDRTAGSWISTFNRLRDVCDYEPSTGESSKIERAMVILGSVLQLGEKAVVFSWRIEPLHLLNARITGQWNGVTAEMVTGRTSSTERSRDCVILSDQGAATYSSLFYAGNCRRANVDCSNHVVFLNEWWNPAVNTQARDRVNRIGQTKDVFVYRLRTSGTIETQLADY